MAARGATGASDVGCGACPGPPTMQQPGVPAPQRRLGAHGATRREPGLCELLSSSGSSLPASSDADAVAVAASRVLAPPPRPSPSPPCSPPRALQEMTSRLARLTVAWRRGETVRPQGRKGSEVGVAAGGALGALRRLPTSPSRG